MQNWHNIVLIILKQENKKCVYHIGLGRGSHGQCIKKRKLGRQKEAIRNRSFTHTKVFG
jgi:hypothetical protein